MGKSKYPGSAKPSIISTTTQSGVLIKQVRAMFASLIGCGLVMIQPFLSHGASGVAAKLCVISFAIAIPLMTALLMLDYEESPENFRAHINHSPIIKTLKPIAQLAAIIGLIAGFWHIDAFAGIAMLIASAVGIVAYYSVYTKS